MKFLKNTLALSLVLGLLMFNSCSKDCTPPDVSENIIGSWDVQFGGTNGVEFKADGTLIDPDSDIIGGEINGDILSEKSYTATNDSLYVQAASATSTNMIDATFPIVLNECDAINFTVLGISVSMSRK